MKIKSLFKRIVAAAVGVTVMASALVGALSVFAKVNAGDFQILYNTNSVATSDKLHFSGLELLFTGGDKQNKDFSGSVATANINDYDLNTAAQGSLKENPFFELKDGVATTTKNPSDIKTRYQDKSRYVDIILNIKSKADISDIVVKSHPNKSLMTKSYAIFASADRLDLFDSANLVSEYTNPDDSAARQQIQNFHFNSSTLLNEVKYVAMRIYDPCSDWDSVISDHGAEQLYFRLFEFNVYGKYSDPNFDPFVGMDYKLYNNTNNVALNKKVNFDLPEVNFTIDGQSESIGQDISRIYDYDLKNETKIGHDVAPFFTIKNGQETAKDINAIEKKHNDKSRYLDIILPILSPINAEDFLVVNHKNSTLMTKEYEVYAASERSKLFEKDSLVAYYENGGGSQIQDFHFDTPVAGVKYIAMRIYDPAINWTAIATEHGVKEIYVRLFEFNVYGTYEDPNFVPPDRTIQTNFDSVPTDKKVEKLIGATFTKDGTESKVTFTPATQILDNRANTLAEVKSDTLAYFDPAPGYSITDKTPDAIGTLYTDGSRYTTILLTAISPVNIQSITLGFHREKHFRASKFDIYASSKLETLYDSANCVYSKDANTQQNYHFKYAVGKELKNISYVAIRIYNPSGDWNRETIREVCEQEGANIMRVRLTEFNFYGEYTNPDEAPRGLTDTYGYDLSTLPTKYGENLIAGSVPKIFENGRANSRTEYQRNLQNAVSAEPSNDNKHCDLNLVWTEKGDYIDLRFKINTEHELNLINGFAFQGIYQNNDPYYTREFEIYVAEEPEDVFLGSPAFVFDAKKEGVKKGIVYEFKDGEKPKGNYFGIRIKEPYDSEDETAIERRIRVSLLYVWGEKAEVIANPTNLAENMPIDAYFTYDGQNTPVSDSNLTVKEVFNLTDASNSTKATVNTEGEKRNNLNIVYNLCGDMKIDRFSIDTLINSTTGFKSLKIYGAPSLMEVGEEDSILWTYTPGKTGNITASHRLNTAKSMRYVRVSFIGTKDYVTVGTINVEGLDNQKNKTRNITSSIDTSDIEILKVSKKTGALTYINYIDEIVSYLVDGDRSSYLSFHQDDLNRYEYEIILGLGDLRTVSSLRVDFTKFHEIHHPETVRLYTAESDAQLTLPEDKGGPTLLGEYKADDLKKSYIEEQFKPFLSRYIKIVLTDFKKNEAYREHDGTYLMNGICSEIKVMGTKVRGMQTSETNETIVGFKDKKSGMTVNINRIDQNDVFDKVAGMKVTPVKATNWQMRSLEQTPYLEIINKKVYKITFTDIYGNPVTDLGGRTVTIVFTPTSGSPDSYMIGDAADRKQINVLQTSTEGKNLICAANEWKVSLDNSFAILSMTTADDPYWDSIGELENFDEENEKPDKQEPEHDAEWYKSIHTEDGLFEVTGVMKEIENKVKFTATDVSQFASDEQYIRVLEIAGGKQIAAFFDMELSLNNREYVFGDWIDIKYQLPAYLTDNFTDLEVVHLSDDNVASYLWSEINGSELLFQTNTFSNFAIIGNPLTSEQGSVITPNGSYNGSDDYWNGNGDSPLDTPQTGESAGTVAATFVLLVAAAYVSMRFGKREKTDNETSA